MVKKKLLEKIVDDWKEVNKFFLEHTPEEVERQKVSYARNMKPINSMDAASLAAHGLMSEGLIHTYPTKSVIRMMRKEFDFAEEQICSKEINNGEEQILITIPDIEGNVKLIKRAMDRLGWFFSTQEETFYEGWVKLYFGKKFQSEQDTEIRQKYDRLYHITPIYYANKIRNIGISPKSKNNVFKYPGRCYLIYGSHTMSEFVDFAQMLYNSDANQQNRGKYKIFILDTDKIPKNAKLYYDATFPFGVFTGENIPPTAIIGEIDLDLMNLNNDFYYE